MIDPCRLQTPCRIKMILIGFKVYGPLLSTTLKNPHIADTNKTTEITFIIIFKSICFFFYFKLNYFCGVLEEKITIKRKEKICLQAMQFIVLVFNRSYRKFRSDQTFPECKITNMFQNNWYFFNIYSHFFITFKANWLCKNMLYNRLWRYIFEKNITVKIDTNKLFLLSMYPISGGFLI